MKPLPPACACGVRATRMCDECGQPICARHGRLGISPKGQKEYLCFACDDRRHQQAAWQTRG
jgi:hypothetical protein